MKKLLLYASLLALVCLSSIPQLSAQNAKIGLVDMEKVFQEYFKTKIADANLKKQAEVFKEYADKLSASLSKLQEEFRVLRDQAQNVALSDVERENRRLAAQDKYRQLREKEEEYKNYSTDKQNVLRNQYEEQRGKLLDEIRKVIQRRAVAEGYNIVLDSSGKSLNDISPVIYFNPAYDITESVISEINVAAKEKIDEKTQDKTEKEKQK